MFDSPSRTRPWSALSYVVLSLFLLVFLFLGIADTYVKTLLPTKDFDFPDFHMVKHTRVLSEKQLGLDDTHKRTIIVGDVHGMNHSLHALLSKLNYNPGSDTLIFAGDLLAKSSQEGSLGVLDFLTNNHVVNSTDGNATQRIFAVRGNHDQLVIQWRAWREWFEKLSLPPKASLPDGETALSTGREFIDLIESEWEMERSRKEADAAQWVDVSRKRAQGTWRERWWKRIPPPGYGGSRHHWVMFSDHYWLARVMTPAQSSYLKSLPLVLHVPSQHFFVVHAGILPSNPRLSPTHPRQPLTHLPKSKGVSVRMPDDDIEDDDRDALLQSLNKSLNALKMDESKMRRLQEQAILREVPQNQDPWVPLNMRSVKKNGKITRHADIGEPWDEIWNDQMNRCDGFKHKSASVTSAFSQPQQRFVVLSNAQARQGKDSDYALFCRPSTVVFGHSASRGLDIKRWSIGLDTGCLYGRRLTALVLNRADAESSSPVPEFSAEDEVKELEFKRHRPSKPPPGGIQFGEKSQGIEAKVVGVKCTLPGS